jgi:integrase
LDNAFKTIGFQNSTHFKEIVLEKLSGYIETRIDENGTPSYTYIKTEYFIQNDRWTVDCFGKIENFKKECLNFKKGVNRNIVFNFNNSYVNNEIKAVVLYKVFTTEWNIRSLTSKMSTCIRLLSEFINQKYSKVDSLLSMDINKASLLWYDWLERHGYATKHLSYYKDNKRTYEEYTTEACFLGAIHSLLINITDLREEWDKDIWNVKNLEKHGIRYNMSESCHIANFNVIDNVHIRNITKQYVKNRLIINNRFSWNSAMSYLKYLPKFLNFITAIEPSWNDLQGLTRVHIEKFIEYLPSYICSNASKVKNREKYIRSSLGCIYKFLCDIQLLEYPIAPKTDVRKLIFFEDKPRYKKKSYDKIDYIPDMVLEQLMKHFNFLNKEVQPLVLIMLHTGLRISDTLALKQDCLAKLNNKFWLITDIEKTYVKDHRIPISDELANIIAVLIAKAKEKSNRDNNPNNLIFVRYTGKRKGRPYGQGWVRSCLNILANDYNVVDELGNVFHFSNHPFRHTFAVKMLNSGVDILIVQELLAHSSPEMTLTYAKLLDDTKRAAFDTAVKSGVFSFNVDGELFEENNMQIDTKVMDMLWTNHKLTAIDNPYGTCRSRIKGKCSYSKSPPCLTCNSGKPCKDLEVGLSEVDIEKYKIHIRSAKAAIEIADKYNRPELALENKELLLLYENILSILEQGNIIFGRIDRLITKERP